MARLSSTELSERKDETPDFCIPTPLGHGGLDGGRRSRARQLLAWTELSWNQIVLWANTRSSAAEAVEILDRSRLQVAAIADSVQCEHKHAAGVLAWTADDNLGQVKN